ncbi:F0F1 ATP synthase subunit delta [Niveibacterium umoris]|uniref:ATP synthase subunit delta n=1 Tax=Niveibacterium umoris TaxID=1193620 RepID=A0A840BLL4_9RHOO|nr:F0F1 ATP synthase subunit delta [Niveibacterium umoris]MBB4013900.1 F-type H+-transporting ATPase subunit delta [Niveibacterium umoris]
MAENVTVARPYAEAAFKLAREANALDAWVQALSRLAAVASEPRIQDSIGDPRVTASQAARMFVEVAGDLTADQKNFVSVLAENERLGVLPEIHDLFAAQKDAHEGVKDALVSSAFPIDDATLARLIADLEVRFKAKVKATVKIDPELIGGVKIAVGDEVIDASVRGKLAAMAAALQN